jgi:transposase
MYLKKNKQNGRIYLSIADGYYDKTKGHSRTVIMQKLGYLDELEKQYLDPIAHFSKRVEQLKKEKADRIASYTFTIEPDERLSKDTIYRKNFGHTALSKIYHELEIDKFLLNRQRSTKLEFDTNNIMKLLVFSRLLRPASKKKTFEERSRYFEKENYSLDDIYRCLTFLNKQSSNLQLWLNDRVKQNYGRDTSLVSKEHRPNPIVQMGLFTDNNALPITYQLFSGNTNDCLTYRPNFSRIKTEYDLGRVVVVADKGMCTGDNIWYTLSAKDGYVFSLSVRGSNKELKDYVLKEDGYEWLGSEYKRKSRLYPRSIWVTSTSGKKMKKVVHEKQVIFYSEKYDKKAKAERAAVIAKAQDLISNPGRYTRNTSYGAVSYIKGIDFDKETGEILTPTKSLSIDWEKIKEDEALDGYYAIVTSEHKETDDKIIEMYRGLWKIEEAFRVTKSDLEARPVYVSREDHINAHFLTCFVSLLIARILEMKTDRRYSIGKMLESLDKSECTLLSANHYLFDYIDDVLLDIGSKLDIDFSYRSRTLGDIKKVLAETKK